MFWVIVLLYDEAPPNNFSDPVPEAAMQAAIYWESKSAVFTSLKTCMKWLKGAIFESGIQFFFIYPWEVLRMLDTVLPIFPSGYLWYLKSTTVAHKACFPLDCNDRRDWCWENISNYKQGKFSLFLLSVFHLWRFYICKTFTQPTQGSCVMSYTNMGMTNALM